MTHNPWGNYKTAPVPVKIAGWVTIPFVLFFIMHTVIQFIYEDEMAKGTFVVATWIYELYHFIWCGLPLFLYLTGSLIAEKKMRITMNIFVALFGVCYALNVGNAYEWVDIPHLQYPQSIALLGILVTWLIHLFRRKKNVLDIFKAIWLIGLCYAFIVPRFVRSGHESGNFYLASLFVFPVMMGIGLYYFFANKNHSHE